VGNLRSVLARAQSIRGLVVVLLLGCRTALAVDASVPTPATFIVHWLPQAQFAGYYVAHEHGFYRQHGIDLRILSGGPDWPASGALLDGTADFATLWLSTGIRMRSHGAAIVNIAQIVQRSSLMLIAKKSTGINTPGDLNGKRVSVWEGDFLLQPQAFFKTYGLDVRILPQASSINLFLRDGVEAATGMWFNEYHTLLSSGVDADELTTFFFHEHGLNFPEDGIYCREATFARAADISNAFVQASLEGWHYAFAHPEDALDIVMRYMSAAHLAANRVHQRWMLARMQDVILPPGEDVPLGTLCAADYARVAAALRDTGRIDAVPEFESFYRGSRLRR
jgi:NitT/TauT family transport system substrate-binding protein